MRIRLLAGSPAGAAATSTTGGSPRTERGRQAYDLIKRSTPPRGSPAAPLAERFCNALLEEPWSTSQWRSTIHDLPGAASGTLVTTDRGYWHRWKLTKARTINRIGVNVTNFIVASTAYVALYSDDGNNKPTLTGGRLGHASIATTANGFRENGADLGIALTPCYFWAFVVCTHGVSLTFTPASPTMPQLVDSDTGGSSAGRFAHIQQSGLTGITEAPATIAPDGNIGSAPVMWLK